jgi:uncharacterized membrane protein SpoIIM required for sporulation
MELRPGRPAQAIRSGRSRAPDVAAARVRFEQLLDRAESSRSPRVSFRELRELGTLYQLHAALLARLRDDPDDPDEIRHLNALCVRGYALLYAAGPERNRPLRLRELLARTWRAQLAAWLLMGVGLVLGAALAAQDPRALPALVPEGLGYAPEMLERLWESPDARAEFLEGESIHWTQNAWFGSSLFAHNTRMGILSFATGVLAGIPTVILQLYNGVIVGALSAIFFRDPLPVAYLAWILPHGIPELIALCLCAAAGLELGVAVAAPGRRGRVAALRHALQPVVLMVGSAAPLFAVAALTESFLRESSLGVPYRLSVAGGWVVATVAFLAWTRRLNRRVVADTRWLAELSGPLRNAARDSGSAAAV